MPSQIASTFNYSHTNNNHLNALVNESSVSKSITLLVSSYLLSTRKRYALVFGVAHISTSGFVWLQRCFTTTTTRTTTIPFILFIFLSCAYGTHTHAHAWTHILHTHIAVHRMEITRKKKFGYFHEQRPIHWSFLLWQICRGDCIVYLLANRTHKKELILCQTFGVWRVFACCIPSRLMKDSRVFGDLSVLFVGNDFGLCVSSYQIFFSRLLRYYPWHTVKALFLQPNTVYTAISSSDCQPNI